jgi:hypothetical protein
MFSSYRFTDDRFSRINYQGSGSGRPRAEHSRWVRFSLHSWMGWRYRVCPRLWKALHMARVACRIKIFPFIELLIHGGAEKTRAKPNVQVSHQKFSCSAFI